MSEELPRNESAEKIEDRKSRVRVRTTYWAATFLFGGGAGLIAVLFFLGEIDKALTLFNTILPISSALISYWFAGRQFKVTDKP